MLRDLLLRDLMLHKRALVGALVTMALILAAWSLGSWEVPDWTGDAVGILGLSLFLVSALPFSLQIREILQGTLGDLLVLPAARRDLVRARLLEGLLACGTLVVVFLLFVAAKGRWVAADLRTILGSSVVAWVPALALGYTLPFACAGSLRGARVGLSVLAFLFPAWVIARVFGPNIWNHFLDQAEWALERFYARPGMAMVLGWIVPILLLAMSYRISCFVAERAEP